MPGWELIGKEEKKNLNQIFTKSNGIMFAHGFDHLRNNIFLVRKFESLVKNFLKVKYCVATTSGTMAQFVAMKALGIKPNDEVITQSFTFVATVEAIAAIGAKTKITEIDETFNMDYKDLEKKISKKTKLIVPVPMLGNQWNVKKISEIAKKNKIKILEDACESFGAKYKNKYLGTISDVGVFSLDFAKTITTGEGGLIVTNDKKIYNFCREFIDHGHENNKKFPRGKDTRKIFGLNLRMTELQAAVGIAQIKKIKKILKKNNINKKYLKSKIKNNDIIFRKIIDEKNELSDTLIFTCVSNRIANNLNKNLKKNKIATKNIPDAIDWHFSGTWKHLKSQIKDFDYGWSRSSRLLKKSIAIPIMVKQTKKDLDKIALVINKFFLKNNYDNKNSYWKF